MSGSSNYVTATPLRTRLDLHGRFSVNPDGWHRWVLRHLELRPGMRVMDLGCGTGALWTAADPEILERLELVPCDSSDAMLDAAREGLAHAPGARFERIDLDDEFELPANPDVVVCNHVLYHVADVAATLARLRDLVSPTTRCLFATNGERNLAELLRLFPDEAAARASRLTARFTLESGAEHVRRVFGGVDVVRYADALAVTEVEPLMAYVESIPVGLDADELRALRDIVEAHIDRFGELYLNKDAGLLMPIVTRS